jgi:nitronate monooxygenase
VTEVRSFFKGPILLSGTISTGANVLAAQAIGADLAYVGTRFLASDEAHVVPGYKQMILDSESKDIVYTPIPTGVHGNYLGPSLEKAGIDPKMRTDDRKAMNFASGGSSDDSMKKFGNEKSNAKPWKDIWSAGQGVSNIHDIMPAEAIVAQMRKEYAEARQQLLAEIQGF